MRLLLDECIGDRSLRDALVTAGHDVVRAVDERGGGADDLAVFAFACEHERIVLTYNNADFKLLGEEDPKHPGMLLNEASTDFVWSILCTTSFLSLPRRP